LNFLLCFFGFFAAFSAAPEHPLFKNCVYYYCIGCHFAMRFGV
jgi:hypothetical protein